MPSFSAVMEMRRAPGSRLFVLLIGLMLDRSAAVGTVSPTGSAASPEFSGAPLSTPSYMGQDELQVAFLDTLLEAVIDGNDGDNGLADELKNSLIEKVLLLLFLSDAKPEGVGSARPLRLSCRKLAPSALGTFQLLL